MTMSRSRHRPDILIENSEGYPIAFVEVKNLQNLSRDIATELRHNLIEYGVPAQVPYFLLLSQDVGFLWKETKQIDSHAPPTYEFPMHQVVTRYLKEDSERRLYGHILELLVFQWLNDLATKPANESEEPEKTLALSGFSKSIKGAAILTEENQRSFLY
jgi:hypothetical protein